MNFRLRPVTAVSFFMIFFLNAFFAHGQSGKPQPKLETLAVSIQKAGGGSVSVNAELARTKDEQTRGLMFRKTLPDGEGMLFVYDRDERMSFWMKNTLIPLSIAYISRDGIIIDIFSMKPLSTSPVRASRSVRYALEVPQGWFARSGITRGDRLSPLPK